MQVAVIKLSEYEFHTSTRKTSNQNVTSNKACRLDDLGVRVQNSFLKSFITVKEINKVLGKKQVSILQGTLHVSCYSYYWYTKPHFHLEMDIDTKCLIIMHIDQF